MLAIDPHYPNLIILSLLDEADVRRLLLLLSGKYDILGEVDLGMERPRPELPAGAIANLVLSDNIGSIEAKSVVVEFEYVDRDSNIAYALVQARVFRDYPRRTVRLHFFRKEVISYDELLNEEKFQESYLGFCVLSSSQPGAIGRTVLPPPRSDKSWVFVPPESVFSINLGGAELQAKGTAFIEQDGRVAACASAATWMSTIVLARRFSSDILASSPAEITQLATKYSSPPSGFGFTPGLTVGQVLWALHEMGYEALAYEVDDPDSATELVYTSVESGIPPILIVYLPRPKGWHAVTACGHIYENIRRNKENSQRHVLRKYLVPLSIDSR